MTDKQSNYFVQLFKGDVPLVVTFWVFNVLVAIVILYFVPILLVHIISQLYLLIALWNSAGKYEGPVIWKIIVKIWTVTGIILALYTAAMFALSTLGIIDIQVEELLYSSFDLGQLEHT